jgi:hypothetical protein
MMASFELHSFAAPQTVVVLQKSGTKANEAEVIKIWNLVLVETNRRLIDQSTVLRDLDFIPCKGGKSQKKKIVGKPSFKPL